MINFKKFEKRLPDSLTHRVGELMTLRLAEFSLKHSKADFPTRRVGKSFFDYEYLHEFEAKIRTAQKVV
jgi:hypothetical protein